MTSGYQCDMCKQWYYGNPKRQIRHGGSEFGSEFVDDMCSRCCRENDIE